MGKEIAAGILRTREVNVKPKRESVKSVAIGGLAALLLIYALVNEGYQKVNEDKVHSWAAQIERKLNEGESALSAGEIAYSRVTVIGKHGKEDDFVEVKNYPSDKARLVGWVQHGTEISGVIYTPGFKTDSQSSAKMWAGFDCSKAEGLVLKDADEIPENNKCAVLSDNLKIP